MCLLELNSKFKFYEVAEYYEVSDIHSDIVVNKVWYKDLIAKCDYNRIMCDDYEYGLQKLILKSDKSMVSGVPYFLYRRFELELIDNAILAPVCWLTIKSGDRLYTQDEVHEMLG